MIIKEKFLTTDHTSVYCFYEKKTWRSTATFFETHLKEGSVGNFLLKFFEILVEKWHKLAINEQKSTHF